ncbi:MAG: radical SAM protein [Actinomycetota bacterium]|jgi:putative pyruvate formate lyase activating enzyme|nr:radical SAM protein [Actinomycetota bacterium]MDD5667300.1 radical SAM protein [Actinomycetota bacterium]
MLEDYFSILEKKAPARHWTCSHTSAGAPSLDGLGEEDLWPLHEAAMARWRESRGARAEPPPAAGATLLELKAALARRMLRSCRMCERRCGVDRTTGETGYCGVGAVSRVASNFLHFGEEPELVPSHTTFFSGCTFHCAYCQNWDIAMDARAGSPADPLLLADSLRDGMKQGSRNANFVGGNPDPNLHTILDTIIRLGGDGKHLPMVWNSNMYTSEEAMRLLEGVMDVYLGDFRYGNDECASRYSDVDDYFRIVSRNFIAARGQGEIMLRHLLLPGHLECCGDRIMSWAARNLPGVYFNLMFQYRPEYRAALYPEIDRRPSQQEKMGAVEAARRHGIALS